MAIHIGEIIKKEVEQQRLTYKEFGALIHRNEKTIPEAISNAPITTSTVIPGMKKISRNNNSQPKANNATTMNQSIVDKYSQLR